MAILIECLCRKRQSLKNRVCSSCGCDLVKAKKAGRLSYWVAYYLPGKKLKVEKIKDGKGESERANSLDYAKCVEAKRRVQKKENRILDIKPDTKMTFKELSDWYLGLESVKILRSYDLVINSLKKFNSAFGDRIVSTIRPSELEGYRARRKREGKANSTIDQEIGSAKTAVNKAFDDDDGLVSGETLKRFKKVKKYLTGRRRNSNARKRTLTPTEFQRLAEGAPAHLKPILWMGYDTGMRLHEILTLTWERVSLKERLVKLRAEDTKDGEARAVPICNELLEILSRLPRGIQSDYRLFSYNGKPIEKDIRTAMTEACERAGIVYGRFKDDGFIFHDLRRTFMTDMRRAGVDRSVTMEITGHSKNEVIDRYNPVSTDDMREGIERMIGWRKSQAGKSINQSINQS